MSDSTSPIGVTELVRLSENPELLSDVRVMVHEYLSLADTWAHLETPPSTFPAQFQPWVDEFPEDATPPRGEVLVGLLDGELVALGVLAPNDDISGELHRIYVRESARRNGIARRLVTELLEIPRDCHYKRVILDVIASREPAIALYQSIGFVEGEPFIHELGFPLRYMEIELD